MKFGSQNISLQQINKYSLYYSRNTPTYSKIVCIVLAKPRDILQNSFKIHDLQEKFGQVPQNSFKNHDLHDFHKSALHFTANSFRKMEFCRTSKSCSNTHLSFRPHWYNSVTPLSSVSSRILLNGTWGPSLHPNDPVSNMGSILVARDAMSNPATRV